MHLKSRPSSNLGKKENHLDGTLIVAKGMVPLYAKSKGVADHVTGMLCDLGTQYNIGSLTKQFTAAAILNLLYSQESTLDSLNKPLSHYLTADDLLWEGEMPVWAEEVTLHHLLTHTSGIVNYTDLEEFEDLFEETEPSTASLVKLFRTSSLRFKPGTKHSYCNTGYFLLSQVVERLSGQRFGDYLRDAFFKPLGMHDTFLPATGTTLTLQKDYPRLARGYLFDLTHPYGPYQEIKQYWPLSIDQGDGGIISTAPDLLKWNHALYHGQVIPMGLVQKMQEPYEKFVSVTGEEPWYGYGIDRRETDLGFVYSHGGNIPGFRAYMAFLPELDLSIISLSNLTFDFSSNQKERNAIRAEISHLKDESLRQEAYNKIFAERHPEVKEILRRHELFRINHLLERI